MERHPHILNASTNLLGICFIVITGLRLTNSNANGLADEFAWVAAVLLLSSTLLSYLAIRNGTEREWQAGWADHFFLAGLLALFVAIGTAAFG